MDNQTAVTSPARRRPRTIGRRACDACKIRKIRCSEIPPCDRCHKNGLTCTFNKAQAVRGPRHLREKTIRKIERARAHPVSLPASPAEASDRVSPDRPPNTAAPGAGQSNDALELRIPVPALAFRLGIYRLRLFPIWPIISVGTMLDALHSDPIDLEAYVLATAIAAATMAQLKLQPGGQADDTTTAAEMEAECRRIRLLLTDGETTLSCIRTAFFLHVYHENQIPGGPRSLLYLREAITLAQIQGLHLEDTYNLLPLAQQQLRRRILYLLFVTERGVAILHSLPTILRRSTVAFPSLQGATAEEAAILPAFSELVHMFWLFDQSGVFELLLGHGTAAPDVMHLLQSQLRELAEGEPTERVDVQRADLCVTRMWMQAVLWKLACVGGGAGTSGTHPVVIARDLLWAMGRLPSAAIEAHGTAVEFKIFQIASTVIDAVGVDVAVDGLVGIVGGLQGLLAGCRGGNPRLLASLDQRVAELTSSRLSATLAMNLGLGGSVELWGAADGGQVGLLESLPADLTGVIQGSIEELEPEQDPLMTGTSTPSLTMILEELLGGTAGSSSS